MNTTTPARLYGSTHQKGCLTIFYSIGSCPLRQWQMHTQNGYAKRVLDDDIKSLVLEIMSTNVSNMYMFSPRDAKVSLGIKLPFLVMLIKNLHKYFTFEVKILDDTRFFRRFRVSNFQSATSVKPFCTSMPMGMSPGWNQIHFNLADFTRRAYGTNYMEAVRIQIHANVRIRRVYFSDRLYADDDLPNEYRLLPRPREKRIMQEYKIPAARPPSPAARSEKSQPSEPPPSEPAMPDRGPEEMAFEDDNIEKY